LGIETYQGPVIYMRSDCAVCRSEGFEAQSRVVTCNTVPHASNALDVTDLLADAVREMQIQG
jgi:thymidine phosphorylase